MTAFHLPPGKGFSGTQRTLSLLRDLPQEGWQPLLLHPHPRAYPAWEQSGPPFPPAGVTARTCFCLDTSRHLAWRGRYSRWLALPDRWASWWLGAVPQGLGMIRHHRPELLWVTYPIATALTIALTLHRWSRIPLVVDLRDPVHLPHHPSDPLLHRMHRWLEWQSLRHAALVTVTTSGTRELLLERYPGFPPERMAVVENGFDEEAVRRALLCVRPGPEEPCRPLVLIHSGTLYSGHEERNPEVFLTTLAGLLRQGRVPERGVRVRFRGSGDGAMLERLIQRLGLQGVVEFAPVLEHGAMLEELAGADGLLLLQGSHFDRQVPAKLFEYFGLGRPILGLVGADGASAGLLREAGLGATLAPLHDGEAMAPVLEGFLRQLEAQCAPVPLPEVVVRHGRRHKSREMAQWLEVCRSDPGMVPRALAPLPPDFGMER